MYKYGIIITSYRQRDAVERNILRVRNEYSVLADIPIIVVTTAEDGGNFQSLEKYNNVFVIEFKDAPSEHSGFKTKSSPILQIKERHLLSTAPLFNSESDIPGGAFRYKYLAARIILSIRLGLLKARELGLDAVLHLHSDSYILPEGASQLENEFKFVLENNLLILYDVASEMEKNKRLPIGFQVCPENILFNLRECQQTGYGFNFDRIYNSPNENGLYYDLGEFCTDFSGTECLLSTWAHFILTGKNIFSRDTPVDDIYWQKVKIRQFRPYHGTFGYFINEVGTQ